MLKPIFTLLVAAAPVAVAAQITWSAPMEVAPAADGAVRPRIVLTANDVPLVFWGDGNPKANRSARFNGVDFDPSVQVTPTGAVPFVTSWAGSEIAASNDTVFAVIKTDPAESGHVYCIRSLNGGNSWEDTVRVDNIGHNLSRYPAVAVIDGSKPVVAFMKFEPGWQIPHYVACTSTDAGASFGADALVTDTVSGEACDCCPATVAASNDAIAVVFRNNDNNVRDMFAAVSSNGGTSFPNRGPIDDNGWQVFVCPSSGADALFAEDRLITVFMNGQSGDDRSFISSVNTQNLNDLSISQLHPTAPAGSDQNMPRLAGNGDTLGVVYEHRYNGQLDVFFSFSVTGPNGFSLPDTINVQLLGSQRNPDIAYANGVFHICWQDDGLGQVLYRTIDISNFVGVQEPTSGNWCTIAAHNHRVEIALKGTQPRPIQVQLEDVQGRIIQRGQTASNLYTIDAYGLPTGTYLVRVQHPDLGTMLRKVYLQQQ